MKQQLRAIVLVISAIFMLLTAGCSLFDSKPTGKPMTTSGVTVQMLDIGQGDAILIRTKEKTILVDTGDIDEKERIVPLLKQAGVSKLDAVMISHPHADHLGGFSEVVKAFDIGQIYDCGRTTTTATYQNYLKLIKKEKIPFHVVTQGETLDFGGGVTFEVLGPPQLSGEDDNMNNASIVGRLVYGDFTMLFTGDSETEAEKVIRKKYAKELKSDVLKAPHHGSKTSSSAAYLQAIGAKDVLISCGKENDYKHPHGVIMKRYQKQGMNIYRTDQHGMITIESDGKTYRITKEKEA